MKNLAFAALILQVFVRPLLAAEPALSVGITGTDGADVPVLVRVAESDHVGLALPPGSHVQGFAMRVRAASIPASLRVVLDDGQGETVTTSPFVAPTDRWLEVDLPASAFHGRQAARLVLIEDVTGELTDRRGQNAILIDDVEVR